MSISAAPATSSLGRVRVRLLGGASSLALPMASAALVLGVALSGEAGAQTTVNPNQTTTYTINPGSNPITFDATTNINTTATVGADAVDGAAGTNWNVTNHGKFSGNNHGIYLRGTGSTVTNAGTITATNTFGVLLSAGGSVTNQAVGTITGLVDGILISGGAGTVSNAGTITSTIKYGVELSSGGSVTNQTGGTISGQHGGVYIRGNGSATVTNAGTITGTGGAFAVAFSGSGAKTLILQPGSVLNGRVVGSTSIGATNALQLGGPSGADSFDVTNIGASLQYRNFNSFSKVDTSTWTLIGTGNQNWSVQAGTLIAGSNGLSGAFTVSGGVLGGGGTIGSLIVNAGGTVGPGVASPFTILNVSGNATFAFGSFYRININGAGQNDKLAIGGSAALTGGSVQTLLAPGSYSKQSYDILHATGGLGGTTFAGVSGNMPGFAETLSYTPTDVFLNLTAGLGAGGGLSINQQNVANSINNFFNGGGTLPAGFVPLFGLSGGNLGNALTQLSGETATGAQQTTFDAMNQFMGILTDPFIVGRGEPFTLGSGATPYAEEDDALAYAAKKKRSTDAYAMFSKAPMRNNYDPRWSVWAAGFGGSQSTDGNAALGSNNTTSRVFGVAAGADYVFSPRTIAGFALAGGGTNFSVANGGTGRSDLFQVGAFIRHNVGAAYITAAAAYGWQDVTTDRTVTISGIDQLRARFNANAYSGRVEGGYRFVAPWVGGVGITPYAAGQFTTFDLPAYAEGVLSGANTFALAYGAKSVTDSRSELGIRTDKSFAMSNGILTLRGRAAWAHDYDPDRSIGATFQTLPGASFVVNGAAQASDSALTTVSAEMKWINGWSAAATFEGEFSDVTRSYAGKGVVRYSW